MRAIDISSTKSIKVGNPGPVPMLQWVAIADLVVDDRYQRDLKPGNWKAIRKIAESFLWSRFSPVFVAPVEGGKFAIIDGQHRTHAAALCGYSDVPCQIVQMSAAEQVASFAAVNGLVTKVTPWNILKASILAEEPWAVACADACAAADCILMTRNAPTEAKKPGEVFALGLVRTFVDRGQADVVTACLAGLRRSEFGQHAAAYSNEVLKPLLYAVGERPWLIEARVDLSGFVDDFDIYAALDRAEQFAKVKRRQGVADVSRYDLVGADIGEALDKAFPRRMAAAPGAAA